jgi:hypothetical protein
MDWRSVLFLSMFWWIVGAGFFFRPQTMFRLRFAPLGPSGDGLTEDGEQSYKRFGIFLILIGVAFAIGLSV